MFKALLNLIRGYTTEFNAYERAIIEAVAAQLPEPAGDRLRRRVASINCVHRLEGGREVIGYCLRRRKPALFRKPEHPPELRLTDVDGVVVMARFSVDSASRMSRLKGKITLTNGQFAIMNFNAPTEHAEAESVDAIHVTIGKTFKPIG